MNATKLALVLSGGNALGAFQAGAYQAIHEHGLAAEWVVGTSIGAANGAIICGNPSEQRVARLREFWGASGAEAPGWPAFEEARRTGAAVLAMGAGHPGAFTPRHAFGPWWNPLGNDEPASLYDTIPLGATLKRLVDFERLATGVPRFSVTAVDLESGDDVMFDSMRDRLTPDHLRASGALLPAFPAVEIAGRLLGDGGLSANLAIDVVLREASERPLLCIALDLLPLAGERPQTLGDAANRMQDLMFATQSRRSLAAWQAIFDERLAHGAAAAVTVLHVPYADQQDEVSGKAFDFSAPSAAQRWRAGYRTMSDVLVQFDMQEPTPAGLAIYRQAGASGPLERVRATLASA